MKFPEPFTVSIGSGAFRYSFTLNKSMLRMTIPDVAVTTMSREEWLAVVAVFWEAYQDEIRTAGEEKG